MTAAPQILYAAPARDSGGECYADRNETSLPGQAYAVGGSQSLSAPNDAPVPAVYYEAPGADAQPISAALPYASRDAALAEGAFYAAASFPTSPPAASSPAEFYGFNIEGE